MIGVYQKFAIAEAPLNDVEAEVRLKGEGARVEVRLTGVVKSAGVRAIAAIEITTVNGAIHRQRPFRKVKRKKNDENIVPIFCIYWL